MLRLLGWVRPILRWLFATEAVLLAANTFFALRRQLHSSGAPMHPVMWAFHAAVLIMAGVCAAAWWTTRPPKSGRNLLAIAACIANILLLSPTVYFVHQLGLGFGSTILGLVGINVVGIVAFWERQAPSAAPPPKLRRVVGDCTNPWTDKAVVALSVVAAWSLWGVLHRFASQHKLPYAQMLPDTIFFVLAIFFNAAIHECSHALVASFFDMRLLAFNAGPIQWRRVDGRGRFRFSLSGLFGGSVAVVPTHPDQPDWHEACVLVAGPLANLCTAPFFFWAAFHIEGTAYVTAWPFLSDLATFALIFGIFNFFPIRTPEGAYSDGAQLLQLLTKSGTLRYARAIRRLQVTLFTPIRSRDLDAAELQQAADVAPSEGAKLHAHVCAAQILEDQGRIPEAAASIADAEAIYNASPVNIPALLHTAFIYFHAAYNHDASAARLWWDRMNTKQIERKNVDYWIGATAIAWIEGRRNEAEEAWQQADIEARKLPHFGAYEFDRSRVALLRTLLDGPAPEPVVIPARVAPPCAIAPDPSLLKAENKRALLVVAGISIALLVGFAGLANGSYVSAAAWHCGHGNHAQVGSYRLRLPWRWRTLGAPNNELTLLGAGTSDFGRRPKIMLMPADPDDPPPPSKGDPDQDELNYVKQSVTLMNRYYPSKGWATSLVVLKPKPFPIYCERMEYSHTGENRFIEMTCHVGHTGDVFLYTGPPSREPEAESILSSIQ